jgi:hypothetical protein
MCGSARREDKQNMAVHLASKDRATSEAGVCEGNERWHGPSEAREEEIVAPQPPTMATGGSEGHRGVGADGHGGGGVG